ncbi:MAG: ABC transporter permease [Armatimonadota bacterium]|nr:ABC transporter permease [Armatimonadota bacterium]MDR7428427.1 ABC transporter permease [Armatimonadota bacterium]MDR7464773.1 ABC transporter permease [Armatimonadota bacterium]MDR7471121.1 ABC transporter permease [Armatimonadota bacterium]MDR7475305.1 ABC transporter permease [Armatimonadota bacterium]
MPSLAVAPLAPARRYRSLWALAWLRLLRNRAALAGMTIVLVFVMAAVVGNRLVPFDPFQQSLARALRAPGWPHPLGTDEFGRDILSRIVHGARISSFIGLAGVGFGLLVGGGLGTAGGYLGGRADQVTMRLIDILLAFPGMLLALAIVSFLGPGLENVLVAVGIYSVPLYARVMRGSVLALRTQEFVEAARALGASDWRILWRHILPNALTPVIVISSLRFADVILTASGLSFLGLGAQPPLPEWGAMLASGRVYLRVAPWVAVFPGVALALVVFGFNLLGDGLRDALDPRMKV